MNWNLTGQLAEKPIIGISECILGRNVRYDGGHKRDHFVTDILSRHVIFEPVCPEVAIGLGVPREPLRKISDGGQIRVVGVNSNTDQTDALDTFSRQKASQLNFVSGYIFMQRSPSCGVSQVTVYSKTGIPTGTHCSGSFAERFMQENPHVPVEGAGRLKTFNIRRTFFTAVFAYWRWQQLCKLTITPALILQYFDREKYLLVAHQPALKDRWNELQVELTGRDWRHQVDRFIELAFTGFKTPATKKQHLNVLIQIQNDLQNRLSIRVKSKLAAIIEKYRTGAIALAVPLEFIRYSLQTNPDSDLQQQTYLAPFPDDLGLNRIKEP